VRSLVLVVTDVSGVASDVRSAFLAFTFAGVGVETFFVRAGVTLYVGEASRSATLGRLLLTDSQTDHSH